MSDRRRTDSGDRQRQPDGAVVNARSVIEQEELARRLAEPDRRASQRFWSALVLARDVQTLEALLDGESVPLDRLHEEWVARLGRQP